MAISTNTLTQAKATEPVIAINITDVENRLKDLGDVGLVYKQMPTHSTVNHTTDNMLVYNKEIGIKSRHGEGVFNEKDVQPYNTQKPLYGQTNESSCVAGSCKMVLSTEIPEAYIHQDIGTDVDGTYLRDVLNGLKTLGFNGNAIYKEQYNIDRLKQSIEKGETVIITVKTKSGGSHAVVIDGFIDNRVIIRDPWPMETGNSYTVPINKLS